MRKPLTLFLILLLSGSASCSDDEYVFHPYEPEKPVAEELTLLKYDFLDEAKAREALSEEFNYSGSYGSWQIEERGLTAADAADAGLYLGLHRRITIEERVTRVRLSLFSTSRFGLQWLERDGGGGSLFTIDAVQGTLNIIKYWGGENDIEASVPFVVENGHTYVLEAVKSLRSNTFTITDEQTGATASVATASVLDSNAGGNTVQQNEFRGGRQNCLFGLRRLSGKSPYIKSVEIAATVAPEPLMIIYGNSITEGDHIRESARYGQVMASWLNGRVLFSGQSGSSIFGVIDRIANEVPVIRPKYVMVTIGTNLPYWRDISPRLLDIDTPPADVNTWRAEALTREELVRIITLIRDNGAIPVINRIPVRPGHSVAVNELIASVCEEMNVASCRFDLATALDADNLDIQNGLLFQSDNLHPNIDGAYAMAKRLFDIPGILLYAK